MIHVGLHSVATYHNNIGRQNQENKNIHCRVSRDDTRQSIFLFFYFVSQNFCGMFLHYVDLHVSFVDNFNRVFNRE